MPAAVGSCTSGCDRKIRGVSPEGEGRSGWQGASGTGEGPWGRQTRKGDTFILHRSLGYLLKASLSLFQGCFPSAGFQWSGCSDNLSYGIAFSKAFMDSPERSCSASSSRGLMNLHNNEVGRKVRAGTRAGSKPGCRGFSLARQSSVQPHTPTGTPGQPPTPRGGCILLPFLVQHCADYPELAPACVEGDPSLPYALLCSLLCLTDPTYDLGNYLFCSALKGFPASQPLFNKERHPQGLQSDLVPWKSSTSGQMCSPPHSPAGQNSSASLSLPQGFTLETQTIMFPTEWIFCAYWPGFKRHLCLLSSLRFP